MKTKGTIFNLDKCYSGHDLEQHSRGFSRSDTLDNANAVT